MRQEILRGVNESWELVGNMVLCSFSVKLCIDNKENIRFLYQSCLNCGLTRTRDNQYLATLSSKHQCKCQFSFVTPQIHTGKTAYFPESLPVEARMFNSSYSPTARANLAVGKPAVSNQSLYVCAARQRVDACDRSS